MSRRALHVAALILGFSIVAAPVRAQAIRTVVDGLAFPAGITFDRTGTMYVTERAGRILSFRCCEPSEPEVLASIPTTTEGETGLLGISISPDDAWLYAFVTAPDRSANHVVRVPVEGGEPEVVIDDLAAGVIHNGGGVVFGDDGMLYVSQGEVGDADLAQDPDVLAGKVYRYTPEGVVPEDNPFGSSPAYSIGHRNPYGIALDPISGDLFVAENGPESHDEINRVVAGGNAGWPVVNGPAGDTDVSGLDGRYRDPVVDYPEIIVPTGIAFAPDTADADVAGDLFFAAYGQQALHRIELDASRDRALSDETIDVGEPVVAVAWGPEGLYFSTPDSVKLLPFEAAASTPGAEDASTVGRPSPNGSAVDDPEGSSNVGLVLIGGAALVLVAALAYAFGGKRRART